MKARLFPSASAALLLSGCGGGGDRVTSTPPPIIVTPTPTPAPAPTPPPTIDYRSAEYGRSTGLPQVNAAVAYERGATGRGVTVGVVDSGIDIDSPEFAGRISGTSADLVASRGLQDESGHGTAVSATLLGAKNDAGAHGVAFDATLLVLRTDTVGSCATDGEDGGCRHSDAAMARALDRAVANGARVVNISLGGSAASSGFRSAIARAAAAGLAIVISAGNDGATDPDGLALVANDPGARGQVVIAGSVDSGAVISSFSNRAGTGAVNYMVAPGERIRAPDEEGTAFLYSGTSFAAPHVSGALALLAQAFPNLGGRQLVEILYQSARDLGAAGVDPVYGQGMLDIGRAFQPLGARSLAGSAVPVAAIDNAALSAPMGDAGARGAAMGAVILDGFDRAFAVDLASTIRDAPPRPLLAGALTPGHRLLAARAGPAAIALTIRERPDGALTGMLALSPADADGARATAGLAVARIDRSTQLALGIAHGGHALAQQIDDGARPAFLVARDGGRELGFDRLPSGAVAIRHQRGGTGFWSAAEQGDALLARMPGTEALGAASEVYPYASIAAGIDRRIGPLVGRAAVTGLMERDTVLGARFGPLFGTPGASSLFLDFGGTLDLRDGWSAGAAMRRGRTTVAGGGARSGASVIQSAGWRLDLAWRGDEGDSFGLRVSQPLRVLSGAFRLDLPIAYDVTTGVAMMARHRFDLAPIGRELVAEGHYGFSLLGGRVDGNAYWRHDPGHVARLPDDVGLALRFVRPL